MTTRSVETEKPPPLPGDCLPIPEVRTEVRDARGRVGWVMETHVVAGLDLDGHGSPVVLVPPDRRDLNEYGMWWRLFIQRGACGHELGIVMTMLDPIQEPGTSHGLRDFSVVQSISTDTGDSSQGVGVTTYVFNGTRYVSGRMEQ